MSTMLCELSEGMYLNIAVIVTCFVASVTLSLLINVFYLYTAIVKHLVLIFVTALYKSPLLLLSLLCTALPHTIYALYHSALYCAEVGV